MTPHDWNWYYSNPAKAADTIASLHTLLWDILDDLAERSRKTDADGCKVLNLSSRLVRRIDEALDYKPRADSTVPAQRRGAEP